MKRATPRQQKLAAVYDAGIWPLLPERAAEMILRQFPRIAPHHALEVGSASGKLAMAMAERMGETGRLLALEPSPALLELAEAAKLQHPAGDRVSFQAAELSPPPLPVHDDAHDLVVCNLALADMPEPAAAVADMKRCLKPGGRLIVTVPLRGSWAEFLDLYANVLTEQMKLDALAALRSYERALPDAETVVGWLESAGLRGVAVDVKRWEVLFKSAREFFFAPLVEMGPLPAWKQIAGGRGDEMQDVFFFVKEAIETYFSGGVFPVTMVVGCLQGTKPPADQRPGNGDKATGQGNGR